MGYQNLQEMGRPITIKDGGVPLTHNVGSMDMTGSGHTGSVIGDSVTEDFPGGGGQTPWTSNIDAANNELLNLKDISFFGTANLFGHYNVLSSTTFSGSGLNDISIVGIYNGTTFPTYTFTLTNTNTQTFSVGGTTTGWNVGDSVRGNTGAHPTGTIRRINGLVITVEVLTGSFIGQSSVTDTTTSVSKTISRPTSVNMGTFSDGTTTITYASLKTPEKINGITYNPSTFVGHTVGDVWSAQIIDVVDTGLYLGFNDGQFAMGDINVEKQGNVIQTYIDTATGKSLFSMQDKFGTYVEVNTVTNEETHSLGQKYTSLIGGSGYFMSLDASGVAGSGLPVSSGVPVGGAGTGCPVLFVDPTSNLGFSSNFYYNTSTNFFSVGFNGNSYLDIDGTNFIYTFGDDANSLNGTKIRLNDASKNIQFLTAIDGSLFMADIGGNVPLLIQHNSGNPNVRLGAFSYGNQTLFNLNDLMGTVQIDAINGVTLSQLGGGGSGAVGVDNSGLLGFIAGINATITTAPLTVLGSQGSMTFTNGVLTAQTPAT